MNFVKSILNKIELIDEKTWSLFEELLTARTLEKGEQFTLIGDSVDEFAFVKDGVFKTSFFSKTEEKEQIKMFTGQDASWNGLLKLISMELQCSQVF